MRKEKVKVTPQKNYPLNGGENGHESHGIPIRKKSPNQNKSKFKGCKLLAHTQMLHGMGIFAYISLWIKAIFDPT